MSDHVFTYQTRLVLDNHQSVNYSHQTRGLEGACKSLI